MYENCEEQAIVCQHSARKRKGKPEIIGTSHNITNNIDNSIVHWIENSFGAASKSVSSVESKGNTIDLNESDLFLAQVNIESLSQSPLKINSSSLQSHSDSATLDKTIASDTEDQYNANMNLSCGEQDLFEENTLEATFCPNDCVSQSNSDQMMITQYSYVVKGHEDNAHCDGKESFLFEPNYNPEENIFDDLSGPERNSDIKIKAEGYEILINEINLKQNQPTSLKEKMKKKLLMNRRSVPSSHSRDDTLREEALAVARMEASQIRKQGTSVDIGPFYGLPSKVEELFKSLRGVSKLYDWQVECLELSAVREHKHLIYSLPTSGGKTLVAEILILRELLCHQKNAMLVLPFVSIVQEKVRMLTEFASELGFLVEEYAGSKGKFPPLKRRKKHSLYIATIEKGHSLINNLIENERLDSLGLVVIDELHMLGEGGSRGSSLESLIIKLIYSKVEIQVIGMSATLNNVKDLQQFLKAEVYTNNFRPVSLQEYVKVGDNIYQVNNTTLDPAEKLEHHRVVLFPYTSECSKRDPDHLFGLVTEVIPDNSCLVFCSTKKNCENVAQLLGELICKHHRHLSQVKKEKRKILLRELCRDGNGQVCPVLNYTIHFGIAYHHSGLTADERRLIEDAYMEGTLCLLTCTSTLAAGVNLPARRVILRSPFVGRNFIKYSQYKQMSGRAGRAGIDASGESILIARNQDRMKVKDLLSGPRDYCYSSLIYDQGKGIQSLLLSAIGLKLITSTQSAFQFLEHSLLYIQAKELNVDVSSITKEALQCLIDQSLVLQAKTADEDEKNSLSLKVTDLGRATFKGSVDHIYSLQLYKDLKIAEQSLVLSNHFHLLYLVTPYDSAMSAVPDWSIYYTQFCNLTETELHVAKLLGISESYLDRKAMGLSSRQNIDTLATNRFFLTLILWKLWNQNSIWDVASQFSQPRGFVQNLLSQSAAFASCVYHFCQELEEFWAFNDLLANFVKRLSYCVTSELIPLMEIPGVKLARAKQLYSAGYTCLSSLAAAESSDLIGVIEHLSKRAAQQIISASKNLLEDKTSALLEEVESLVSLPNDDK